MHADPLADSLAATAIDAPPEENVHDWFDYTTFENAVYPRQDGKGNRFHDQTIDQMEHFWTPNESMTELAKDVKDFPTLPMPVQAVISAILHFLFAADAYASQLTAENLAGHFPSIFIKGMLCFHAMMEIIHAQAYGILLEIPYGGAVDMRAAFAATTASPAVKRMIGWGRSFTLAGPAAPAKTRMEQHVGLLAYEGLIFTPLFVPIYGIKQLSRMPALCSTNEFVARDELKHANNVLLCIFELLRLGDKLEQATIHQTFRDALAIAEALMLEALPEDVPAWNLCKHDCIMYAKLMANKILAALEFEPLEKIDFELPDYLQQIGMSQLSSFHTVRPTEYKRAADLVQGDSAPQTFDEEWRGFILD